MNEVAEQIRDGLNFLISQANLIGAKVETGANKDVFAACLHSISGDQFTRKDTVIIQHVMGRMGWTQWEGAGHLEFTHNT